MLNEGKLKQVIYLKLFLFKMPCQCVHPCNWYLTASLAGWQVFQHGNTYMAAHCCMDTTCTAHRYKEGQKPLTKGSEI